MVPQGTPMYQQELERRSDPDADVHEQTVVRLQAVRVRRELSRLPILEQLVLRWRFGIAGSPILCRREIADRLGLSLLETCLLEERAFSRLRVRPELKAEMA